MFVLPEIDPVYKVALPFVPVVRTGAPLIIIFPPVAIPAAVLDPAWRIIASVPVPEVLMLSPIVKFPEVVDALNFVRAVVWPMPPPDNTRASEVVMVKVFAPLIFAEIVCWPAVLVIVEAPAKVIAPLKVLLPDKKLIAPILDKPVPVIDVDSATVIPPEICNVAPLAIVVEPAAVPRALAFVIERVPAEIEVEPV